MISAGIDVGIKTVKAVILRDGQILARRLALSGGFDRARSAEQVWGKVLQAAGLPPADVNRVIATGTGKWDVRFANDYVVEPLADVRAALWLFPSARSVIDIGADQARVVRFDVNGRILDYVLNQKCAAGLGTFAETMARTLEVPLEKMSELSLKSQREVLINAQCAVFAELDVVSLIHNNTAKADIARAVNDAIATKLSAMVGEITVEKDVVLFGGVASNIEVVNSLKKRLGVDLLIPEKPALAGALGAGLIAAAG